MAKQDNNKGIVYVLSNSAMPGLVKIGRTTRENVDHRMHELYRGSSGVPVPFKCEYACEVTISDCIEIEKALHEAFSPHRVNAKREFFEMDAERVIVILKLFRRKDITTEVTAEIENDLTADDKEARQKIKSTRRPPLNYKDMGVEIGSKLLFAKDPMVEVIISGDKRVSYQGEEVSLTAVTKQLLGITHALQPTAYWTFEGKNLRDIYDETYTLED